MFRSSWPIKCALLVAFLTIIGSVSLAQVVRVSILLRPDDPPPAIIAPRSEGMIPVGILSTDTFDALTLAPPSLRLGPTGTEAAPFRVSRTDVDRDGDADLQVLFSLPDTEVACEDTTLTLKGRTVGGEDVEASAAIVTEGC